MILKVAVCDDDERFLEKIKKMLNQICQKNNIDCNITQYCSAEDLMDAIQDYHVLFIDIEMPHENGLDAVKRINQMKGQNRFPLIIFVTNMDNLVFSALEHYPFGFLRKTHLSEELEKCVLKVNSEILYAQRNIYRIKKGRNFIILDLNNILYLEKEKNYVKFVSEKEVYKERTDINKKYSDLHNKGFIRVHIGFLVNRQVSPQSISEF